MVLPVGYWSERIASLNEGATFHVPSLTSNSYSVLTADTEKREYLRSSCASNSNFLHRFLCTFLIVTESRGNEGSRRNVTSKETVGVGFPRQAYVGICVTRFPF